MVYKICAFLLLASLSTAVSAQKSTPSKWWVNFSDKANSPFCTCRPAEFLSARALDRRARAGISVVESDLPVNPAYIKALVVSGVRIHSTSKWLNSATIIADSASAMALVQLPFVEQVQYLGPDIKVKNPPNKLPSKRPGISAIPKLGEGQSVFGYASLQNSLLGVPFVHATGDRGAGIWIAVMDGGFTSADVLPFFDSVALQGRLYQGWDFVERDGAVYESASHGTSVLSVMASDLPGYFVGTAPEATYFLLKTEDTGGEFPVEETNWIAGAEWADSIGVDLINASLGYTVFNDTTLSHTFADLDGHSSLGSRGAAIATSKGMLILNSAGNSGEDSWKYLGVPADAPGVIAVGAVQHDGSRAGFSSIGPTADGRIKPDLMAPGEMVVVAGSSGTELGLSNGTSLAAPMLTGALASLWSGYPQKTADEILTAVTQYADQASQPDNLRGYGLPDLALSWLALGGYLVPNSPNDARNGFFAFDREGGTFRFVLLPGVVTDQPQSVELRDLLGNPIRRRTVHWKPGLLSTLTFSGMQDLPPGFYHVVLHTDMGKRHLAGLVWP
ncbi:MAG: S8 family serine peptidase [Lewinellaceae bacterium]|nr:S8 family serine peptidase [Lewinellaceae bacterium]